MFRPSTFIDMSDPVLRGASEVVQHGDDQGCIAAAG